MRLTRLQTNLFWFNKSTRIIQFIKAAEDLFWFKKSTMMIQFIKVADDLLWFKTSTIIIQLNKATYDLFCLNKSTRMIWFTKVICDLFWFNLSTNCIVVVVLLSKPETFLLVGLNLFVTVKRDNQLLDYSIIPLLYVKQHFYRNMHTCKGICLKFPLG